MKKGTFTNSFVILFVLIVQVFSTQSLQAQQNLYGTAATDQHFTHVFPDGQDYYILGQDGFEATITRVLSTGAWDWTQKLNLPSGLLDAIVMPNGNLLFVGLTLQFPNQSIIGEIQRDKTLRCLNIFDSPGTEGIARIDAINATTYLAVGFHTANTPQDIVIYKISTANPGCAILEKYQFNNSPGADYGHDIVITAPNSFMVCGNDANNNAVIYHYDLIGGQLGGVVEPLQYEYVDMEPVAGDLLAAANSLIGGRPYIVRFDSDLLPIWEAEIFGLTAVNQILIDANDKIYVVGTASGINRTVILKLDDCNGTCPPSSDWPGLMARYLDNGSTYYSGGYLAIANSGLVFVDGREGPGGFGMEDGFLSITDADLTSPVCMAEHQIDLNYVSTLFASPIVDSLFFYDVPSPVEMDVIMQMWDSRVACETIPLDSCICGSPVFELLTESDTYQLICLPHGVQTPVIPCPSSDVLISGHFGCIDVITGLPCNIDNEVFWILNGPGGTIDGGVTQNLAIFTFPPSYFQTPGTYQLTVSTLCGVDTCICILDWIVECADSCVCSSNGLVLTQHGTEYMLGCSDTSFFPEIGSTTGPVSVSGFFGCVSASTGELCEETPITWSLNGPNGFVSGGVTTPFPALLFQSSQIGAPGTYTLTLSTLCPGATDSCYCFAGWVQPCDTSKLDGGLWGNFPFYGNANDMGPLGINGVVNGATLTTGYDNQPGSAYDFDGTDWIEAGTHHRNVTDEVTVAAWVRTTEQTNGQWIAGKYQFSNDKGYLLAIGNSANNNIGKVSFSGRDGTNVYHNSDVSQDTVNDGEWHCVVGTAGNGTWKVYVDGSLANMANGSTLMLDAPNVAFTIGKNSDPNIGQLWMNGDIDNVLLYSRVLTDEEIECLCSGVQPHDSCDCLGFEGLSIITNEDVLVVQCGNEIPYVFSCPDTDNSYLLHGNLICADECGTSVDWTLLDGTGSSILNGNVGLYPTGSGNFHFDLPYIPYQPAGDYTIVLSGHCGSNTCECVIKIKFLPCALCACNDVAPLKPNLVVNGDFSLGDNHFTSGLTGPGVGNPCQPGAGPGTYCVSQNFQDKETGWPFFCERINPCTGAFLIIDGSTSVAADVWSQQVIVVPGMTYEFSFWIASVYPIDSQVFSVDILIRGTGTPASELIGSVQLSQATPTWENHCFSWTCPPSFTGPFTLAINQGSPDHYRDFGLDDICFTKVQSLDTCCQDFEEFLSLIAHGFQVTQNGCEVTVCANQFDTCHVMGMAPYFGDGTPVPAVVVSANDCWTHTYSQSGTYTICATVYEDTCYRKEMCVTVNVICDPEGCICPENALIGNPGFENGTPGLPNSNNQIAQATGWFASNNGSNVNSIGDWFSEPTPYFPGFYLDVFQGPLELKARCGSKYGGIDLATCEGISSNLLLPITPGSNYNVGFYWSISQPVTTPFNFHAILSNANCTVNKTATNTCTHQCNGDFHIVVPVTPIHSPGVWYYHNATGTSTHPSVMNNITFAGMLGQQAVNNYLFIDQVCITASDPDTCHCVEPTDLTFTDGNIIIPTVSYNATPVSLSCDTTIFNFSGKVHCSNLDCLKPDLDWVITDEAGIIVRLGTKPLTTISGSWGQFDLQAPNSAFIPGVVYTITITTYCGNTACPFSVQFVVDCDPCICGKFQNMMWQPHIPGPFINVACGDSVDLECLQPDQGLTFSGDFICPGDNCPPSQLQWTLRRVGSNAFVSSGVTTGGASFFFGIPRSDFANAGLYQLTITGICNGKKCASCVIIIESYGCPCACELFDKLMLVNKKLGVKEPLDCDNASVGLTCPPLGQPYKVTGRLLCTPSDCKANNITWELKEAGGGPTVATGTQQGPWFSISLGTNELAGLNGLYQLFITGNCGSVECSCILNFDISGCPTTPACPCDNDFYNRVAQGFTYVYDFNQGTCDVYFTPNLTPCDNVTWTVDGQISGFFASGTSTGNQSFKVTFPNNLENFDICMQVTRIGPNGPCILTYCATLFVNCGINGFMCESNIIENGGFGINTVPGLLGHGGSTQGWSARAGFPELIVDDGCSEASAIKLVGQCAIESIDIIDYPVLLSQADWGYTFSACYKAWEEDLRPGMQLVLRLAVTPQDSSSCAGECIEVAWIPIEIATGDGWNTISHTFTIDGWDGDAWLTLHIENDLVGDDEESNSTILLDDICLVPSDAMVPTEPVSSDNSSFAIFPNPNSGEFYVKLNEPTTDNMRFTIIGLTGQIVLDQLAKPGLNLHALRAGQLTPGMYFFQIWNDQQMFGVKKFVKE